MLHPRYKRLQSYPWKGPMFVGVARSFCLPRRSLRCLVDPPGLGLPRLYTWSTSDLDSLRSTRGGPGAKTPGSPPHSMRGGLGRGPSGAPSLKEMRCPSGGATFVHPSPYARGSTVPLPRPRFTLGPAPSAAFVYSLPYVRGYVVPLT